MRPALWSNALPLAAVAALIGASIWSIRAGAADYLMHERTVEGAQQAMRLAPDQSEAYARLAWLTASDDPHGAKAALERAVALNPRDTRSRIELGLLAEAEGAYAAAVGHLQRAAADDHLFLPRWTLANYYFRRGDTSSFWHWAKEAAGMVYGDSQPLFRLCGRVVQDGKLIERLEISDPGVRAGYLSYLLVQNRVDLIGPSVRCLLAGNREEDGPLLWQACERLLEAGRIDEAAEIWNRQADARRAPSRTAAGDGTQLVINSDFSETPSSHGFDWRLPVVEGINYSRENESRGLRITFSGRQPENSEVLVQFVAVRSRKAYDLSFLYRTPGLANAKGLVWRITNASGNGLVAEAAVTATENDAASQVSIETPSECRLLRVALAYRRAPGTTRLEGFLVLRNVALKPRG